MSIRYEVKRHAYGCNWWLRVFGLGVVLSDHRPLRRAPDGWPGPKWHLSFFRVKA